MEDIGGTVVGGSMAVGTNVPTEFNPKIVIFNLVQLTPKMILLVSKHASLLVRLVPLRTNAQLPLLPIIEVSLSIFF